MERNAGLLQAAEAGDVEKLQVPPMRPRILIQSVLSRARAPRGKRPTEENAVQGSLLIGADVAHRDRCGCASPWPHSGAENGSRLRSASLLFQCPSRGAIEPGAMSPLHRIPFARTSVSLRRQFGSGAVIASASRGFSLDRIYVHRG
jgi:hypothetical protein